LRDGLGAAEHVVEHPAYGESVKHSGVHSEADDPPRELIHHDHDLSTGVQL
jgi:hypothetical protein